MRAKPEHEKYGVAMFTSQRKAPYPPYKAAPKAPQAIQSEFVRHMLGKDPNQTSEHHLWRPTQTKRIKRGGGRGLFY